MRVMKLTIETDGKRHDAKLHSDNRTVYTTTWNCAACNTNGVWCGKRYIHSHDEYAAPAKCAGCGADVGRVIAKMDTIFGLEEDEAVGLRCRVYDGTGAMTKG